MMRLKFRSCISMEEVIITLILEGFDQKITIFKEWSWFMLNNLGLVLGMALKIIGDWQKGQN